ncbi:thiamine phosphate synthase [Holophaga foetida]|uniref:thiamine phosphate synthase n=1 Tax=Holophaga foetida TaxID=35839 RepID=UPI0002472AC7|nr:thiamine phosphate synthase [Holophaga foetida]
MFLLAISPGEGFDPPRWERVIHSGIDGLMIREKAMTPRALLILARWVRAQRPELELWVNGRLDVALAAGCGLHTPECYPPVPPGLLPISRPLHSLSQLPERMEARQILVSPVFSVPGKGPELGVGGLHAVLDGLSTYGGRVLALGGIRASRIPGLRHPGLSGLAAIRVVWEAPDPAVEVLRMREAWEI